MKILIVKLSSIGDVVHTLPALDLIRRTLPNAEISWAVERQTAEILRGNSYIDNLIEVDTRGLRREKSLAGKIRMLQTQFADLRKTKYDVALDLQGLLKSALITGLSGAKRRVGFDKNSLREPASRFFMTETFSPKNQPSVIEKNLELAKRALHLDSIIAARDLSFPIAVETKHQLEAAAAIAQVGENFVILNPGGGWATKLWEAERFGLLADRIFEKFKLKSIVTFGPGESDLANRVCAAARSGSAQAVNLSLKGFYELAKHAAVYVGGDTGPTHLAVAAAAPVVGIFGPTEWRRNGSLRSADVCVERTDISCRSDCYRRECAKWICLDIKVEQVLRAVEQRLNSANQAKKMEISEFV